MIVQHMFNVCAFVLGNLTDVYNPTDGEAPVKAAKCKCLFHYTDTDGSSFNISYRA